MYVLRLLVFLFSSILMNLPEKSTENVDFTTNITSKSLQCLHTSWYNMHDMISLVNVFFISQQLLFAIRNKILAVCNGSFSMAYGCRTVQDEYKK